jgi:hypothetical protein
MVFTDVPPAKLNGFTSETRVVFIVTTMRTSDISVRFFSVKH